MAGALTPRDVGHYHTAKRGDAPFVGMTKLDGVTLEELKAPRRKNIPPALLAAAAKAGSVPRTPEFQAPAWSKGASKGTSPPRP